MLGSSDRLRPPSGAEEVPVNEFDLVLPTAVDVREVGMRDGLQILSLIHI